MKTMAKVQERTEQLLQHKVDNVSVFLLALYIRGHLFVLTSPQHSLGTYDAVNPKISTQRRKPPHIPARLARLTCLLYK